MFPQKEFSPGKRTQRHLRVPEFRDDAAEWPRPRGGLLAPPLPRAGGLCWVCWRRWSLGPPVLQGTATDYIGERAVGTGIAVSLTENQSQLFEAVPTCSAGSGVDVGLRGKIAECGWSAGYPTGLGTFPRKRVLLRLLWLLSLLPRTPMSFCLPFTHTVPLFPFGTLKTYPFHLASPNSMVICLGLSFLIHYQGY